MKRVVITLCALASQTVVAQGARDTTQRPMVMPHMPPSPPARSARLAWADSLKEPESVKYDADQDVYFISNIDGESLKKDGKGFISRMSSDGTKRTLRWISSGTNGVTLDAPKGMAIVGDTLWVADITAMRAFNRKSGAPIASIDLQSQGAQFLNDVAVGPDNAVYVTDTEMEALPNGTMRHPRPDRIFRIVGRTGSIAVQTDRLQRPNGLAWEKANARFIIVPFGGDTVVAWKPGSSTVETVAVGPGQYDGIAITNDGRILISSKATSAVHELKGGKLVKVIEHLHDPADIEYDPVHDRIAIPETAINRVESYKMPAPL